MINRSPRNQVYVICPTPQGGHIEHAANLSIGLASQEHLQVTLLSRHGALRYLPSKSKELISIVERLSMVVPKRTRSVYHKFLDFLKEQIVLACIMTNPSTYAVVMEEPRYPWLGLYKKIFSNGPKTILILHNVVEHGTTLNADDSSRRLIFKPKEVVKLFMKKNTIRSVSKVVVHGEQQLQKFFHIYPGLPASSVTLPVSGPIEQLLEEAKGLGNTELIQKVVSSFVCMGELRSNKGYETAVDALKNEKHGLYIIGAGIDVEYTALIQKKSRNASNINVVEEFIDSETFVGVLDNCKAVILPYTQFDAQSGVVAKCLSRGTPFIASNLPSLLQQAGDSDLAVFFEVGDSKSLADALAKVPLRGQTEVENDDKEWVRLGQALIDVYP